MDYLGSEQGAGHLVDGKQWGYGPEGVGMGLSRRTIRVFLVVVGTLIALSVGLLAGVWVSRDDVAHRLTLHFANRLLSEKSVTLSLGEVQIHSLKDVELGRVVISLGSASNPSLSISMDSLRVWFDPWQIYKKRQVNRTLARGVRVQLGSRPSPKEDDSPPLQDAGVVEEDTAPQDHSKDELDEDPLLLPLLDDEDESLLLPGSQDHQGGGQTSTSGSSRLMELLADRQAEDLGTKLGKQLSRLVQILPHLEIEGLEVSTAADPSGRKSTLMVVPKLEMRADKVPGEVDFMFLAQPKGLSGICSFDGSLRLVNLLGQISFDCSSPIELFPLSKPVGLGIHRGQVTIQSAPGGQDQERHLHATLDDLLVLEGKNRKKTVVTATGNARLWTDLRHHVDIQMAIMPEPGGEINLDAHLNLSNVEGEGRFQTREVPLTWNGIESLMPFAVESGVLDSNLHITLLSGGNLAVVKGDFSLNDAAFAHEYIAPSPLKGMELEGQMEATADLDQGSFHLEMGRFSFNGISMGAAGAYYKKPDGPWVMLSLKTGTHQGDMLSKAIPRALIPKLNLFRLKGRWGFEFFLDLDVAHPENLVLDVDLDVRKLEVESLARRFELERVLETFEHTVPVDEESNLTFMVGSEAPYWVPFEEIPQTVRMGVLVQEDGGFYRHNGFSLLHIRGSITRNIRERRFARGASTISMQMVKNVFLSRDKTITRKVEEMILTWQIEELLTKDQILELYLNAIEYGPGVYGIGVASYYYFDKPAQLLTPLESAYLVSIIPGPSLYQKAFQKRVITNHHSARMRRLMAIMVKREYLSEQEYLNADPYRPQFPPNAGEIPEYGEIKKIPRHLRK